MKRTEKVPGVKYEFLKQCFYTQTGGIKGRIQKAKDVTSNSLGGESCSGTIVCLSRIPDCEKDTLKIKQKSDFQGIHTTS